MNTNKENAANGRLAQVSGSAVRRILTAENFLVNKHSGDGKPPTPEEVEAWLIEFAKLHVWEALNQAAKAATFDRLGNIDEDSILNAYPMHKVD